MFWAFASGAANSVLEDLRAKKASEMETNEWERRMEIQEEARRAAEEAQRKNRVINSFEDLDSGKLIETTASGERSETALPPQYIQGVRQQTALQAEKERIEQERKQREFEAKVAKDEAAAISSQRRAEADMIRAGRTSTLMDYDRARTEKARSAPAVEDKEAKRDAEKVERKVNAEVTAAYNAVKSNPNSAIAAAAQRIRFSALSPEDKLAALADLMNATE